MGGSAEGTWTLHFHIKTYMAVRPATTKNETPIIIALWTDFYIKKARQSNLDKPEAKRVSDSLSKRLK